MTAGDNRPGDGAQVSRWVLPTVLFVVIIALVGILVAAATSAGSSGYGWGWMMGPGWGSMWIMGALMMTIPVILLGLLIVVLVRPAPQAPVFAAPTVAVDPALTVRMRYARGEINAEQYRQILSDLQRGS